MYFMSNVQVFSVLSTEVTRILSSLEYTLESALKIYQSRRRTQDTPWSSLSATWQGRKAVSPDWAVMTVLIFGSVSFESHRRPEATKFDLVCVALKLCMLLPLLPLPTITILPKVVHEVELCRLVQINHHIVGVIQLVLFAIGNHLRSDFITFCLIFFWAHIYKN